MTSELTVQLALQAVHAADAALVFEDHCSEIGFDWSVEVHYPRPVYRSAPLVAREHVGTRQAVGYTNGSISVRTNDATYEWRFARDEVPALGHVRHLAIAAVLLFGWWDVGGRDHDPIGWDVIPYPWPVVQRALTPTMVTRQAFLDLVRTLDVDVREHEERHRHGDG